MANRRTEELRDALRGLLRRAAKYDRRASAAAPAPDVKAALNMEPRTAFEALLQQQMQSLEQQLQDLRGRINNLFLLIVGTVALQAIMRVAGV